MRIALLADIHANREALAACMAHVSRFDVDRFIFLGDLVGYGADPAWVVEWVLQHLQRGAIAVLGNHDAAVALVSPEHMNRAARKTIVWTREQLSREHLEFLSSLPLTYRSGETLCVHANAWSPAEWEYVFGPSEARESLLATDARYTFCGHVHEPALYHMNDRQHVSGFAPSPAVSIPLGARRRWLAIAGSVGQPRDGTLAARYAIFDTTVPAITWFEVPFDYQTALRKTAAAGLPPNIIVPQASARAWT